MREVPDMVPVLALVSFSTYHLMLKAFECPWKNISTCYSKAFRYTVLITVLRYRSAVKLVSIYDSAIVSCDAVGAFHGPAWSHVSSASGSRVTNRCFCN